MRGSHFFIFVAIALSINFVKSSLKEGDECLDKFNNAGICKFYTRCQWVFDQFNARTLNRDLLKICDGTKIIVCCTKKPPEIIQPAKQNELIEIVKRNCIEYGYLSMDIIRRQPSLLDDDIPEESVKFKYISKCKRNSAGMVVGGVEARLYEFPHQALLGNTENGWFCGGSLVSSQFVLTAAHCELYKVKRVAIGVIKRSVHSESSIYEVERYFTHPDYNINRKVDDIGLLKLSTLVKLNEYKVPICLPTKQHDDENAVVSGFGKTSNNDKQGSDDLMKASMQRFTNDECQNVYASTGAKIDAVKLLCYGNKTDMINTCNGDSGGPLQIFNSNVNCTYTLIGIVSSGARNCEAVGLPGLYANVYNYLDWIVGIVWPDELNKNIT